MPFDVPSAIVAETVMHVGVPKLRLPASENIWLLIFLSLVHRTTSQGAERLSNPPMPTSSSLLPTDEFRERTPSSEGDRAREEGDNAWLGLDGCNRDENRRSKGLKEGEGEKEDENRDPAALPASEEEAMEPCKSYKLGVSQSASQYIHVAKAYHQV
jgi:hypothetical protein